MDHVLHSWSISTGPIPISASSLFPKVTSNAPSTDSPPVSPALSDNNASWPTLGETFPCKKYCYILVTFILETSSVHSFAVWLLRTSTHLACRVPHSLGLLTAYPWSSSILPLCPAHWQVDLEDESNPNSLPFSKSTGGVYSFIKRCRTHLL